MSRSQVLEAYEEFEDLLITRRNQAWMGPILRAASSGSVLVAAGALHLPGENGLLRLLEKEGFAITRIARI